MAYDLNSLPDELTEDLRFSVLDNSQVDNPDFMFMPLVYLESFNSPAMVLKIGESEVTVPVDWSVAVGDQSAACDIEILPLTSLNDRGFDALCFNPLTSFRLEFKPIEIVNFYNDVKWFFPKMKPGQLLSIPHTAGSNPLCSFFVKEVSRQTEIINTSKLL